MKFMVKNSLNQAYRSEDIMHLIPAEQARAAELQEQGIILAIYVAADLSRAWLVYEGESQADAQAALETLPLYKFTDVEITPLA